MPGTPLAVNRQFGSSVATLIKPHSFKLLSACIYLFIYLFKYLFIKRFYCSSNVKELFLGIVPALFPGIFPTLPYGARDGRIGE